MYYVLVYFLRQNIEPIGQVRRRFDPTVDVIGPHLGVVFPIPDTVGEANLAAHIDKILADVRPFEIRLGGILRSKDHWMFLTLRRGNKKIKQLYDAFYTGILSEYRCKKIEFVPHVGLGLFVKDNRQYDWNQPERSQFDAESYDAALNEANALDLGDGELVDRFHLVGIANDVLDWAAGKRQNFAKDSRAIMAREFLLEGA